MGSISEPPPRHCRDAPWSFRSPCTPPTTHAQRHVHDAFAARVHDACPRRVPQAAVELLEGAGVAALDPALTQQVTADKEAASLAAEAATREALCARVDTYVDERLASEGAFAALDKPKEGEKPEAPATAVAAGLWVGNELVGSGLANDLQTRKQLMRAMMRKMLTYAPRTAEGQPCPKTIERGLKRRGLPYLPPISPISPISLVSPPYPPL